MTTEPQAQTSERVPDLRNMQEASPAETLAFLRERIRADAEKIRALEAEIELGARLRNALYAVIPPNYPSSVNHSAEAGARWDRKYVADADHFLISKEAAYAADEVLHALRGSEIERRGIVIVRALAATQSPRSEAGEDVK